MDKICPDCKGKKGKWQHTHSSLNPAEQHIFVPCKTCQEPDKIPKDKIREEFEKCWKANDGNNYPFDKKRLCYLLYKSCDEEIRELKAFKKIYYPLLKSENEKSEQLEAEIKKLKDALVYARKFISYIDYPNVVEIITKALKDGE